MVPDNSEHVVDKAARARRSRVRAVTHATRISVAYACLAVFGCTLNGGNADNAGALKAIVRGRSGTEVIVDGSVVRVLETSNGASGTHERFVIAVRSGTDEQDVLVADNVDIARPAPVHAGDDVTVKGELAIDPDGPVIHWTHHDPSGRHETGFIRDHGVIYE